MCTQLVENGTLEVMNGTEVRLGKLIREAREARGLSQSVVAGELSESLGNKYLHTTIGKIETGKRSLSFEEGANLCAILGIDWNLMYEEARSPDMREKVEILARDIDAIVCSQEKTKNDLRAVAAELDNLTSASPDSTGEEFLTDLQRFGDQFRQILSISFDQVEDVSMNLSVLTRKLGYLLGSLEVAHTSEMPEPLRSILQSRDELYPGSSK